MRKTLNDIVTDYQMDGDCQVDIDLVVKMWNHTWGIYQWAEQYRLIKMVRLGTESTALKVQISTEQAKQIIERLKLDGEKGMFASATTWRQSEKYWAKVKEFNPKRKK